MGRRISSGALRAVAGLPDPATTPTQPRMAAVQQGPVSPKGTFVRSIGTVARDPYSEQAVQRLIKILCPSPQDIVRLDRGDFSLFHFYGALFNERAAKRHTLKVPRPDNEKEREKVAERILRNEAAIYHHLNLATADFHRFSQGGAQGTLDLRCLGRFERDGSRIWMSRLEGEDGLPFILMETFGGGTLKCHLQAIDEIRDRLSPAMPLKFQKWVVTLMFPTLEAVDRLHRKGVIHRDLKPSNIGFMGDSLHDSRVFDFGLSRRKGQKLEHCGIDLSLGYGSPEQAMWLPEGEEVDVYALGAIFFRLLTGDTPIPTEQSMSGFPAIVDFPSYVDAFRLRRYKEHYNNMEMRLLMMGVDDTLLKILLRTQEYRPQDRPTLEELKRELKGFLNRDV